MGLFRHSSPSDATRTREREIRAAAWERALPRQELPDFVRDRLEAVAAGRTPWVATMTPAELWATKTFGVVPITTVTGTCWFHSGWSWTEGHAAGWHTALERIRLEARAARANAVVDVRLRTLRHSFGPSMDFTLIGTAVKIAGLAPAQDPVIATVPALEFVRLIEMGIVPVGIAIGARYEWLGAGYSAFQTQATQWQSGRFAGNQPMTELGRFWEKIRQDAHADLRRSAASQGNGVLAHTQFGELLRQEREKQPPAYLGRHMVVGTVIDTPRRADVKQAIRSMIDLGDPQTSTSGTNDDRHRVYDADQRAQEGPIG